MTAFKRAARDYAFTSGVSVVDDDDEDDRKGRKKGEGKFSPPATSASRPQPPSLAAASAARDAAVLLSARAPLPRPAALRRLEEEEGQGEARGHFDDGSGGGGGGGDGGGRELLRRRRFEEEEPRELRRGDRVRSSAQQRGAASTSFGGGSRPNEDGRGDASKIDVDRDDQLPDSLFAPTWAAARGPPPMPRALTFEGLYPALALSSRAMAASAAASAAASSGGSSDESSTVPSPPHLQNFHHHHHLVLHPLSRAASMALLARAAECGSGVVGRGALSSSSPPLAPRRLPAAAAAANSSSSSSSSWREKNGGGKRSRKQRPLAGFAFLREPSPLAAAAAVQLYLESRLKSSSERLLTVEELWLAVAATARFAGPASSPSSSPSSSSSSSSSSSPSSSSSSSSSSESADGEIDPAAAGGEGKRARLFSAPFPPNFSFEALLADATKRDAALRWQWRDHLSRGATAVVLAERPREALIGGGSGGSGSGSGSGSGGGGSGQQPLSGTAAAARLLRGAQGRVPPWTLACCLRSAASRGDLAGVSELLDVALGCTGAKRASSAFSTFSISLPSSSPPSSSSPSLPLSSFSSSSVAAGALRHASQQTAEALFAVLDACAAASPSVSSEQQQQQRQREKEAAAAALLARRAWRFLEACLRAREAHSSPGRLGSKGTEFAPVSFPSAASYSSEGLLGEEEEDFAPPPEESSSLDFADTGGGGSGGDEASLPLPPPLPPPSSSTPPPPAPPLSPALFFARALDDPDISHPETHGSGGGRGICPPSRAYQSLATALARGGDVRGALAAVAALEAAHGPRGEEGGGEAADADGFLPHSVSPRSLSLRGSVAVDPHRGLRDAAGALSQSVEAIDEAYYILEDAVVEWRKTVEEEETANSGGVGGGGGEFDNTSAETSPCSSSPIPRPVADLVLEACARRGDSARALETFDAYEGVLGLEPGASAYCSAASALLSAGSEGEIGGENDENDNELDSAEIGNDDDDLLRDNHGNHRCRHRRRRFRPPNRNAAAVAAVAAEASEKGLASPRLARVAFAAALEGRDALAAAFALRLQARVLGEQQQQQRQRQQQQRQGYYHGNAAAAADVKAEAEELGARLLRRGLVQRVLGAARAWRDEEALREVQELETLAARGAGDRFSAGRRRQQQQLQQDWKEDRKGGLSLSPFSLSTATQASSSPSSATRRGSSNRSKQRRPSGGGRSASDEEEVAA